MKNSALVICLAILFSACTSKPSEEKAEFDKLRQGAVALQKQNLATDKNAQMETNRQALITDYKSWAQKYKHNTASPVIQKSLAAKGGKFQVPGIVKPEADSWVEVPRGGGCPWLIESAEIQCVLAHEKETTCEYFCVPIPAGPENPTAGSQPQ